MVGSQAKLDRAKVAQYFHLGHVNAKQFHKRLQMFGITATQLVTYLRDLETSEGK
ncbi:MAG: DUF4093 domain-containing protein [Culicoidibacterales bacterium]